jgi:hypothetical protein
MAPANAQWRADSANFWSDDAALSPVACILHVCLCAPACHSPLAALALASVLALRFCPGRLWSAREAGWPSLRTAMGYRRWANEEDDEDEATQSGQGAQKKQPPAQVNNAPDWIVQRFQDTAGSGCTHPISPEKAQMGASG